MPITLLFMFFSLQVFRTDFSIVIQYSITGDAKKVHYNVQ